MKPPYRIIMGGYSPPTTGFSLALKRIGDRLQAKFGKDVDVKYVYNILSLGYRGEDILWLVENGLLTLGYQSSSYLTERVQDLGIADLPFLFADDASARAAMDGRFGALLAQRIEANADYRILGWFENGFRHISNRLRPVRLPADMKGMKIRVQQSDLWVAMMQALGANATPMPYGEVYTALKTGLVDGAENNWPSYESSRHFEAAKFYSITEHSLAPEIMLFSKKIWDTLAAEDQAIIRQAAKESVPFMRKLWDEREAKSRKIVEDAGSQIVTVQKKPFQDAMKPVYDKFITDPGLKDMIRRIQAVN